MHRTPPAPTALLSRRAQPRAHWQHAVVLPTAPHRHTQVRRALLLEDVHADAPETLRAAGFEVEVGAGALSEDDLVEALQDVHVLGIRSRTQVTKRVLAAAPHLQAVGAFCIGTNQIDLRAATRRGVAVFNAPYSNTRSVVELAVAEMAVAAVPSWAKARPGTTSAAPPVARLAVRAMAASFLRIWFLLGRSDPVGRRCDQGGRPA